MSHPHPELGPPPPLAKDALRVVALGGLGEIGRNMTVFEYNGKLLIVDCGVLFPEEEQPVSTSSCRTSTTSVTGWTTSRPWSSPTDTRTTSAPCRSCSANGPTSRS